MAHSAPISDLMRELIEETRRLLPADADMQVAPEQAAFLTFLTRMLGARNAVEVGTFTGLSSLAIATRPARRRQADLLRRLRRVHDDRPPLLGRAPASPTGSNCASARPAETLPELPDEPYLDLAFIDADKVGYPAYWAELVPRMRPGGVIAVDNVLRNGAVLDPRSDADRGHRRLQHAGRWPTTGSTW